ncbi:MAG TPA: helix-turn-helix transcriptional regulator [Xanthobacteraceae bacterium]|nr:helix-turn-helix transcriptional regulator [Xanthobacteraceae bacterium]
MLTHPQVWSAIDRLAARYDFSASGLAKKAGLDPTSFNRSKRITPEGRPRWPSTESIAKVLQATGASIDEFVALLTQKKGRRPTKPMPVIELAQAASGGYFDERGFPAGSGWDEIPFPDVNDEHAYALEISGHSMAPLYRKGDIIIVSPAAAVRKGNRVVMKTKNGEVLAVELKRKAAKSVQVVALTPGHRDRTLSASEILWIARIVWSSQ